MYQGIDFRDFLYLCVHMHTYIQKIYILYILNVLIIFYSTVLVFCRDSGTEMFVRDYVVGFRV